VYAQDKYKLTGTDKLNWVDNALKETSGRTRNEVDVEDDNGAKEKVLERCWSINYTSCTGLSHGGNPFTSARVVNEHLYKSPYINPSGIEDTKSDYLKHIGIIASDFVDAALARSIYQRNYDTEHKQTASYYLPYYLPTRMRMTYGDSLSDASFQEARPLARVISALPTAATSSTRQLRAMRLPLNTWMSTPWATRPLRGCRALCPSISIHAR
ncbi:MAG: hypothetical protein ACLS89_09770, partial [Collinsella sp.]